MLFLFPKAREQFGAHSTGPRTTNSLKRGPEKGSEKPRSSPIASRRIRRLLSTLLRHFLHSASAHRFQIDSRGERNQSFVSADVRSRFFAANVLFARRECQHETSASFFVVSFADEPAGNLSRVLFPRRKQTDIWTTKRQRHSKRLSFSDDDVGAARPGDFSNPNEIASVIATTSKAPFACAASARPLQSSMQPKKFGD